MSITEKQKGYDLSSIDTERRRRKKRLFCQ